jgi:Fe-S-cluster containining protein
MILIGEIAVDDSVLGTKFACDLNACKGACCTFPGGRGAPLADAEVAEIEQAFPAVKQYLPELHAAVIERNGLVDGSPGNYATQCVDGKACVFVYYDGDIAKCSFERAFYEKKISWHKPLSCHLFPLRIRKDGNEVHYEYFSECHPALERGSSEGIPVHRFVAAPLERAFGAQWVRDLNETINTKRL